MKREYLLLIPLFISVGIAAWLIPQKDFVMSGKLYISEILAKNTYSYKDDEGNYSDFIELYNGYNEDINLKGYHLSDSEFDTSKWTFPDIIIKANSYLIIFASGSDKCDIDNNICHTNFKLSSNGETLTLSDDAGNILSKISYGSYLNDVSYGYVKGRYEFLKQPTPGKENSEAIPKLFSYRDYTLKITEYMSHNKSSNYTVNGGYYDWVEIYNYGDKDINLANVNLSDNKDKLNKYKMPSITLKAGEYIVVYLSDEIRDESVLHANFKLSDDEDIILSVDGHIVDQITTIKLKNNVSYGIYNGNWYYYYTPTPGKANNTAHFDSLGGEHGNA